MALRARPALPACWALLLGRPEPAGQGGREAVPSAASLHTVPGTVFSPSCGQRDFYFFSHVLFPVPFTPNHFRQPLAVRQPLAGFCSGRCCFPLQFMAQEKRDCTYGILFQTLFTPLPFHFRSVFLSSFLKALRRKR